MKRIIKTLFAIALIAAPLAAMAGISVVGSPAMSIGALSSSQVVQIYMGRLKTLPDGASVTAIEQKEGAAVRESFLARVMEMSEQQVRSYWVRIVFTGKGQPPINVADDAEVIRAVRAMPGSIGYVDSKSVTPAVKVLYQKD